MIPRQRLDVGWRDLLAGLSFCIIRRNADKERQWLESSWAAPFTSVAGLSVRSGFDALLSVLALPAGSEILVSAITIRDMGRIIDAHGLIAIPIDLDPATLAVSDDAVRQAVTARTKAVLVAHLFGSRMALDGVVRVAQEHGLLLIEDCAQAYTGDGFRGHPRSDVACFSFGPIKTATALGGGVLRFRDPELAARVRLLQSAWSRQSRRGYLTRLLKYACLKLLGTRLMFTLFVTVCRVWGIDHDQVLSRLVRGFSGGDFFSLIRRQPSIPLLLLLSRRLQQDHLARVRRRSDLARTAIQLLPEEICVGSQAVDHSHWVFPIRVPNAESLMNTLWSHGFDATRGASSMAIVATPGRDRTAPVEADVPDPISAGFNLPQFSRGATIGRLRDVGSTQNWSHGKLASRVPEGTLARGELQCPANGEAAPLVVRSVPVLCSSA